MSRVVLFLYILQQHILRFAASRYAKGGLICLPVVTFRRGRPSISRRKARHTFRKAGTRRALHVRLTRSRFQEGGKTIQITDLYQCNDKQVGLANFIRLEIEIKINPPRIWL